MGVVYEAYDARLERTVAIKVLQEQFQIDGVAAERFRLEARAVAALEHPNICTVHEVGETADGALFLVMPLYRGETLQQRLARGPLSVDDAASIAGQMLRGLSKAHARGIIHRDIKPSNIFITEDGVVKLLDFGVAKLIDVTLTGTAAGPIGTIAYMSPEQAMGVALDARADLWSVGIVLAEMLTGLRPYASGFAAAMAADANTPEPASPSTLRRDVSPQLDGVVRRALARSLPQRFPTADAFVLALESAMPSARSHGTAGRTPVHSARPRTQIAIAAAIGVIVISLLLLAKVQGAALRGTREGREPTVAVLPFVDRSERQDQEYFADGITEELTSTLSRVDGLKVASSTAVFAHKQSREDVATIGRKLGVAHLVEGSLRRAGDQLRITATLVSVADGILWSQQFDRNAGDAFAVQQEIAQAVAEALQLRLTSRTANGSILRPAAAAYESYLKGRAALYLKGRYAWSSRTEAGVRSALAFFEEAVRQDSTYAPALVGVADAYAILGFYDYIAPGDAFPRAETAARRAIALDSTLGAPYATLGYVALYYHWDLPRGEAAFKRAISLEPDYATGHQWYANLLTAAGRFDEAVVAMRRAQQLDPLSLIARAAEGWVLYHAGKYPDAWQALHTAFELNPDYGIAYIWLGNTLSEMDSIPQAVAAHQRLLVLTDSSGVSLATLARTHALAGARAQAEAVLALLMQRDARQEYIPSYEVAKVHAALGRSTDALRWLERARSERSHSLVFLNVDPQLATLRADPRFDLLRRRVLPD